jgi:hypothetical protein
MAEFLLSVHNGDTSPYATTEEMEEAFAATGIVNDEMRAAGVYVFAGGLMPSTTAKVVQAKDGALHHTDGPYLEAKEHIGGFWILDVEDAAAATRWAEKATVACKGAVEIRPFQTG